MTVTAAALFDAVDTTWPAARRIEQGPWMLRDGAGGGKRVSAATAIAAFDHPQIDDAEAAMRQMGQPALFMIRPGDDALDAALQARGYAIVDPVVMLTCPVAHLTDQPLRRVTTFTIWEPLAIMTEIWAQGGIGPARLAVMERAQIKTAVLARWGDKPAGTGFVALAGKIAMVHAVEVLPAQRRQGVAQWIMRQAAFWSAERGAETLAVLCVKSNRAAVALYSGLGFTPATSYHYRLEPGCGDTNHG